MRSPHPLDTRLRIRQRFFLIAALAGSIWFFSGEFAAAASTGAFAAEQTNIRQVLDDAGLIGIVLIVLSVAMLALIVEHLISFRRNALMPSGLAEEVHQSLKQGQINQAKQICQERPSFLSHVLSSGLGEMNYGYTAVEKSMEDSSTEQSARLFRKIEFL
ncbi:MAG: hypothetical protein IID45_11495, partial [Planctomycetes bacterium]|nr:hypothetical protein [Planctomycetota bacterium]